ncbi:ECF transporter S component [Bacillus sp. NEB1478]|uniref:ECF transporter S component n=1 Tax=Bacillus sp. NEB1478 TaxID=3073816 RepID=UPI002873D569|nr:ECF transporter S component [Bacillus sp. NEB1478]WNB92972.1 ECF transporter S component [Bacillus sp. NEB1478]
MQKGKVKQMVAVSMLSTIAYLLMMLDFPFPGLPAFLKIDFSEVPALLAAIIFGPAAGIMVEAIKNMLHYGIVGSFTGVPVGELANFIAGTLFILPVSYMFRKQHTVKQLSIGLITGTILMTTMMGFLNYVIILPAYTWFLGAQQMSSQMMLDFVLKGVTPFNLIKSTIIALLFIALFTRLKPWVMKQMRSQQA